MYHEPHVKHIHDCILLMTSQYQNMVVERSIFSLSNVWSGESSTELERLGESWWKILIMDDNQAFSVMTLFNPIWKIWSRSSLVLNGLFMRRWWGWNWVINGSLTVMTGNMCDPLSLRVLCSDPDVRFLSDGKRDRFFHGTTFWTWTDYCVHVCGMLSEDVSRVTSHGRKSFVLV